MKSVVYLSIFILNFIFVSASTGDDYQAPTFAIHPDLQFKRTLSSAHGGLKIYRDAEFPPNETIINYVLMVTKELAESKSKDCMDMEEPLNDLRTTHLKIGAYNLTLLKITWSNATDLKEPTINFTLTARYGRSGLNLTEAKITLQGQYASHFVIDGKARLLQPNYAYSEPEYSFSLSLGQPKIRYDYLRVLTKAGKVITQSIDESTKFNMLDFYFNRGFAEKTVLQRKATEKLADSWLPSISRRIKNLVVEPRVFELSKTFFQPYKHVMLQNISSEILDILLMPNFGQVLDKSFQGYADQSVVTRNYTEFSFKNFEQFRNNCQAESASWIYRRGHCPSEDLFKHTFNFIYDIRRQKNRNAPYPSVTWSYQKISRRNPLDAGLPKHVSSFHRNWIAEIQLITDSNSHLYSLDLVKVTFSFDEEISAKFSDRIEKAVQEEIRRKLSSKFVKK